LSDRVRSLQLPDRPAAQPFGRWWLPWLLSALFAAAAAFFAVRSPFAESAGPVASKGEAENQDPQRASIAQLFEKGRSQIAGPAANLNPDAVLLESKGYLVAVQLIQVSPKVNGMVTKLNLQEGMHVNRGDMLARLEMVEYESALHKARGTAESAWQRWLELATGNRPEEIAQAKKDLDETLALKQQYYKEWKRNEALYGTNGVSAKEYDTAFTNYITTERRAERLRLALSLMEQGARSERIAAAWGDVVQAEADLVTAQWRLDNCTVEAPIAGTILTKKAEEGNIVNPSAFNISASLCEMADLYNVEVDLAIAERDISKVFKGQKCIVRAEAFLGRPYLGIVSRLMPQADRAKGAIPVRVRVLYTPRIEDAAPAGLTGAIAMLGNGPLVGSPVLIGSGLETQGQYLRPEMGALVTFLNARLPE
jgi:multidrug resistance efflux pump